MMQKLHKAQDRSSNLSQRVVKYEDEIKRLEAEVRVLKMIISEEYLDHYN
jgi:hypothetical protein